MPRPGKKKLAPDRSGNVMVSPENMFYLVCTLLYRPGNTVTDRPLAHIKAAKDENRLKQYSAAFLERNDSYITQ